MLLEREKFLNVFSLTEVVFPRVCIKRNHKCATNVADGIIIRNSVVFTIGASIVLKNMTPSIAMKGFKEGRSLNLNVQTIMVSTMLLPDSVQKSQNAFCLP